MRAQKIQILTDPTMTMANTGYGIQCVSHNYKADKVTDTVAQKI